MKHYLKLFTAFFRVAVRREMAHRGAYLAGFFGSWVDNGAVFVTLYILISSFEVMGGWNRSEVMVLYGLFLISFSIGASFFLNFYQGLSGRIRSGEFDASLTKPIHPFLHEVFSSGFNTAFISHFAISLIIILIALSNLDYPIAGGNVLFLILAVTGASFIQAAILIAFSTMSFFTVGSNPLADEVMWNMYDFADYPITVFPKAIQFILTFILPYAFMSYYPAAALLGKDIPASYPAFLPYLTPAVGLLVFLLSILLWNWGLKNYKSTGS